MTDENIIESNVESTKKSKKVLVLFAHPSQNRSEVNVPLFHEAKMNKHVTAVDLYAEYPDFNIDIEREQQRLIDHDVVVFMFPLYWYSTPSILKEWQDLVLEYGFAYGQDGTALKDKLFLCALSAGGKEEAYQTDSYNYYTIRQLLQPLEQMAQVTHMTYIAPFAIFGSRTAREEHRVVEHRGKWTTLLNKLTTNTLNLEKAMRIENLADLCTSQGE